MEFFTLRILVYTKFCLFNSSLYFTIYLSEPYVSEFKCINMVHMNGLTRWEPKTLFAIILQWKFLSARACHAPTLHKRYNSETKANKSPRWLEVHSKLCISLSFGCTPVYLIFYLRISMVR